MLSELIILVCIIKYIDEHDALGRNLSNGFYLSILTEIATPELTGRLTRRKVGEVLHRCCISFV
jgi:hypothetical protein